MTSSGTVREISATKIYIGALELKYPSLNNISGIKPGDLVEYEADDKGWLKTIRRMDGGQQEIKEPAMTSQKPVSEQTTGKENPDGSHFDHQSTNSIPIDTPNESGNCKCHSIAPVDPSTIPAQIILHKHEGEYHTRPDSITFGESTKVPGLKIYVDFSKPEQVTELVDHAILGWGYAVRAKQLYIEQNPGLFGGGDKK